MVVRPWYEIVNMLVDREIFPQAIHRILLYGPPGTGKSRWPSTRFENVERVTLHQSMPIEDLIGSVGLRRNEQATETVWQDGPAVRAMRNGCCLVLDEIDKHSPEMTCQLHALLDDWNMAGITLPTGERVTPKDGFCVVATSNADPEHLGEPLRERLLPFLADKPTPDALKALPEGLGKMVTSVYESTKVARYVPALSYRSALELTRISAIVGLEEAAGIVFFEKATDILSSMACQEA